MQSQKQTQILTKQTINNNKINKQFTKTNHF